MNNQPDAPDPKFRDEILETFWGPSSARKTRYFNGDLVCHDSTLTHDAYFDYFNRLWSLMVEHQTTGNNSNSASAIRLRDMQALARLAINGEARETILATLHETPQSPNTLNLAASLLSMLKIGAVKYRSNPRGVLSWSAGSLKSFLAHHFQVAPILSCEGVRLPKAFDAWSLSIIGGLEVEFTDNLADHLLYVGDSKVLIFHHATFLEFQQRYLCSCQVQISTIDICRSLGTSSLLDYWTKRFERSRCSSLSQNSDLEGDRRMESRNGSNDSPSSINPGL